MQENCEFRVEWLIAAICSALIAFAILVSFVTCPQLENNAYIGILCLFSVLFLIPLTWYFAFRATGDVINYDKEFTAGGALICFLAGMFLSLFGVVLASIIYRSKGFKKSFGGFLVSIAIGIILGVVRRLCG